MSLAGAHTDTTHASRARAVPSSVLPGRGWLARGSAVQPRLGRRRRARARAASRGEAGRRRPGEVGCWRPRGSRRRARLACPVERTHCAGGLRQVIQMEGWDPRQRGYVIGGRHGRGGAGQWPRPKGRRGGAGGCDAPRWRRCARGWRCACGVRAPLTAGGGVLKIAKAGLERARAAARQAKSAGVGASTGAVVTEGGAAHGAAAGGGVLRWGAEAKARMPRCVYALGRDAGSGFKGMMARRHMRRLKWIPSDPRLALGAARRQARRAEARAGGGPGARPAVLWAGRVGACARCRGAAGGVGCWGLQTERGWGFGAAGCCCSDGLRPSRPVVMGRRRRAGRCDGRATAGVPAEASQGTYVGGEAQARPHGARPYRM